MVRKDRVYIRLFNFFFRSKILKVGEKKILFIKDKWIFFWRHLKFWKTWVGHWGILTTLGQELPSPLMLRWFQVWPFGKTIILSQPSLWRLVFAFWAKIEKNSLSFYKKENENFVGNELKLKKGQLTLVPFFFVFFYWFHGSPKVSQSCVPSVASMRLVVFFWLQNTKKQSK